MAKKMTDREVRALKQALAKHEKWGGWKPEHLESQHTYELHMESTTPERVAMYILGSPPAIRSEILRRLFEVPSGVIDETRANAEELLSNLLVAGVSAMLSEEGDSVRLVRHLLGRIFPSKQSLDIRYKTELAGQSARHGERVGKKAKAGRAKTAAR
jgi:hypothetical protein